MLQDILHVYAIFQWVLFSGNIHEIITFYLWGNFASFLRRPIKNQNIEIRIKI